MTIFKNKKWAMVVLVLVLGMLRSVAAGPVTQLIWKTQPGRAVGGRPFERQPVLMTADAAGRSSTNGLPAKLYVTVRLNGPGKLAGTTTGNIGTAGGNGMLKFTDLQINTLGTINELVASLGPAPGAVLWMDGSDLGTLATDSRGVTNWANKGTRGGSMVVPPVAAWSQPSWHNGPTAPPVLLTNAMNGRAVVRFNGLDGEGGNAVSNRWPGLITGSEITLFMALRQTAEGPNWGGYIGLTAAGETCTRHNSGLSIERDNAPGGFRVIRNDDNASPAWTNAGQFHDIPQSGSGGGGWYNPRPADGVAFVNTFYLQDQKTNFCGANYWTDQAGKSWTNFQISTVQYGNFNISDVALGAQLDFPPGDQVDWPSPIDLGEVLVYTTALSSADRAAVEAYLHGKWLGTNIASAVSAPFSVRR